MKRLVLFFSFLVFSVSAVHSQNAVQLSRNVCKGASKSYGVTISRTVTVPAGCYMLGKEALLAHNPSNFVCTDFYSSLQLATQKYISAKSIASPMDIYGPYRYLRKISDAAADTQLVDPEFKDAWKHINKSGYYNGAHHIINKSVIKRIHADLKRAGANPNFEEMQRDAPAIFHPMHGNPNYNNAFHNTQEQYKIYKQRGVKAVMDYQIEKINEVNRKLGFNEISDEMYDGLMHEAKLWCEMYNLRF